MRAIFGALLLPLLLAEVSSVEEENTVETVWLSDLQLVTRTGLNVDINIPRTVNIEECFLIRPDGATVDPDVTPEVTMYSSSNFVSCRAVVGPMEASLLGRWTLCGSYEENNIEYRRCQNADIVWSNPSNPDSQWQTSVNNMFNHMVHFGGSVAPSVRGSGTPVTCHLMTPNGEDLIVTRDRFYPDIRLVQISNSICCIAIEPIAELHLGEWAIYGMFRSSSSVFNEVRLPFDMELYDIDNPYNQAYNVTNLSPVQNVTNLGNTITIDVTGSGVVDECQVTTPSGEIYLLTDNLPAGVSFVIDRNIRCRLSIGPITEDMLGDWRLNGKFSNRNIFTERRLNFTIIQEDPRNPIIEDDRAVEYLAQQFINTNIGSSNTITITTGRATVQSCHIRTPEGLQYTFMQGFNVPGVVQATGRDVACGVTIRVSEDLIGTWTLIARERNSNVLTERRQPFVIFVADEDNPFEPPYDVTYLTPALHVINLGSTIAVEVNGTGAVDGCQFTMPSGETYTSTGEMPNDVSFVVDRNIRCRLSIGPITEEMLGDWLLNGKFSNRNVYTEFRVNFEIVQEDPRNPIIEDDRTVEYLAEQFYNTNIGSSNTITIATGRATVQSCHIRTPEGLQYTFMQGFNVPGVVQATGRDVACGVTIRVSEDLIGTWTLIARERNSNVLTERRQPFVIFVEDEDNPFEPPYNVTYLSPTQHVINLGSTIAVEVNGTGVVDGCQFTMPSGELYLSTGQMPNDVAFVVDRNIRCRLSIGPISEQMLGEWLLTGKFSNRNIFSEFRLNFEIIQEDPRNPIEEDRPVEYLNEQFYNTNIGSIHNVTIVTGRGTIQSCHIRTPEGLQYTFMQGFNVPGVVEVTGRNVACGVTIHVSENTVGTWTLIARERTSNVNTERRQPFIIYVAEPAEAVPNEITVTEGNSFHVRLANPTNLYVTCKLIDPTGEESPLATLDGDPESCGFIVPSVDVGHGGIWYIYYGVTVMYKANVRVNVTARVNPEALTETWAEHSPVNHTIGPESAVYCRLLSPRGDVVFDGFGRCQVVLDRVLRDRHEGDWSMLVGLPGRIETEERLLVVTVKVSGGKAAVLTNVSADKPTVELSCSVTSSQQKTGCIFRSPNGRVLVANQGVGEGRYLIHVNQTSIDSDSYYSCSLQITDPVTSDLGLWRCDLESDEDNYFGFLTVLCPWAMKDPVIAESVVDEPILSAESEAVSAEENEPTTLACAARAPLLYCYFRAPNGTVFNIRPGHPSPNMEYVGAGFDAGECGARFQSLSQNDSGEWSCHAGVGAAEQFRTIMVSVKEEFVLWSALEEAHVIIQGQVAGSRQLEYCRFVRFDGLGFMSGRPPYPYVDESRLSQGLCRFRVAFSDPDLQPWTVVAKLLGSDDEVSKLTETLVETLPSPPPPELDPVYYYNSLYIWLAVLSTLMVCLAVAAVASSRNRRWFSARASALRASLRASLRKTPPDNGGNTVPVA